MAAHPERGVPVLMQLWRELEGEAAKPGAEAEIDRRAVQIGFDVLDAIAPALRANGPGLGDEGALWLGDEVERWWVDSR